LKLHRLATLYFPAAAVPEKFRGWRFRFGDIEIETLGSAEVEEKKTRVLVRATIGIERPDVRDGLVLIPEGPAVALRTGDRNRREHDGRDTPVSTSD
jgi:hypothetical protein